MQRRHQISAFANVFPSEFNEANRANTLEISNAISSCDDTPYLTNIPHPETETDIDSNDNDNDLHLPFNILPSLDSTIPHSIGVSVTAPESTYSEAKSYQVLQDLRVKNINRIIPYINIVMASVCLYVCLFALNRLSNG